MSILFTPAQIGSLKIPNRIVRSATAEKMVDNESGLPRDQLKDLWVALAKGGTGLIITGHFYVHPTGKCHTEMTPIYADQHIAPLKEIVAAVHAHGARIAAQINHGGMQCAAEVLDSTMAPSAIAAEFLQQPARALTETEILMLIDAYAQAARRVKAAGFDAVQLHGAHGYLINQFHSPFVNQRTDQWGGDLAGRTRFLREVTRAVRFAVGPNYPILIKLGMEDGVEGGLTRAEGAQVVGMLADFGLDGIELSGGLRSNNAAKGIKNAAREAYFRAYAELARQKTDLPILLVGGMRSKAVMESILADGVADFISMSRPLINDPDFPNRLKSGEQTRSACISSNNCWAKDVGVGIGCKCPI